MKIYGIRKCAYCKKDVEIFHKKRLKNKNIFCSIECESRFKKEEREKKEGYLNCECPVCHKKFHLKKYQKDKNKTHCCSKKCMGKYRKKTYQGTNNPHRKYKYDENFFEIIDNDEKAWLLGWYASDGSVAKDGIATISIHNKDIDVLWAMQKILKTNIPIKKRKNSNMVSISLNSKKIVEDIRKHLKIGKGKKPLQLGELEIPQELINHFVRGVFEGDGHITYNGQPRCGISAKSEKFLSYIGKNMGIPYHIYIDKKTKQYSLEYYGNNCLDFLGKIYPDYYCGPRMSRKYDKYLDISGWQPGKSGGGCSINYGILKFMRTTDEAVLPKKAHATDTGYDLTIIKKIKNLTNNVILYDTGIRAECQPGMYLEIVGRSSISKTGYMLANNLGIIDSSYKGNLYVALLKVDPNAKELKLPYRIAQIIPKKVFPCEIVEVKDFEEETEREDGGFGSTGK